MTDSTRNDHSNHTRTDIHIALDAVFTSFQITLDVRAVITSCAMKLIVLNTEINERYFDIDITSIS